MLCGGIACTIRKPPFYYKAPFSPVDVIQEYIRPARLVENGTIVTKPAMSEREIMSFDEVGELGSIQYRWTAFTDLYDESYTRYERKNIALSGTY